LTTPSCNPAPGENDGAGERGCRLNAATSDGAVYCDTGASPALSLCTIVRNTATSGGGVYSLSTFPTLDRSILAFGNLGGAVAGSAVTLSCSDVYGNTGGDWTHPIAEQSGWRGNFELDPRFCDLDGGDLRIWNHSPCNLVACGSVGALPVGCSSPLSVDPDAPDWTPYRYVLEASAFPNPFAGSTAIHYVVPISRELCRVQVRVFDLAGRLVRTLMDSPHAPGSYDVTWDGRSNEGRVVSSGVYYLRVQVGDWEATRSTLRVK
jgi:hypothetical protein